MSPNLDKLKQLQKGSYKLEHSIDFEISEFIKSKILELKNEKRPTPIFFKLGKKVSGRLVVTDVQRYDPLSMPANSDGEEVKRSVGFIPKEELEEFVGE